MEISINKLNDSCKGLHDRKHKLRTRAGTGRYRLWAGATKHKIRDWRSEIQTEGQVLGPWIKQKGRGPGSTNTL